jgi:hypothetical protein
VQWAERVAGGGVEGWVGTEHDRSSMVDGIAGDQDDLRASFVQGPPVLSPPSQERRGKKNHSCLGRGGRALTRPRNIAPFADRCQGPLRVERFRREASPSD